MDDKNKKCKLSEQTKSSKDLLYADYVGSTVVEHVLKSLEKTNNFSRSEEINQFLNTKKTRTGAFERAKRLISMMNEDHESSCLEASADDKGAIEVELTIGNETSDSDINGYKADAWFMLPQSQAEESESSEDQCDKANSCTSSPKASFLDFDDSSSDSSDNENLLKFSVSTERKNLVEVIEDKSSDIDECKLNFSVSTGKRKFCNNIQNDCSGDSDDPSSDDEHSQTFFVSSKRQKKSNTDESCLEEEYVASSPTKKDQLFGSVKDMSTNCDAEISKNRL